jgi:hypothetical protein
VDSSLWVFLPAVLLIAILVVAGYRLRKGVKNEAPGPQGQRPYGVHGWLAFYIGATYYLAPLYSLGNLSSDLSRAEAANEILTTLAEWTNYKAGSWVLVLAAIAVQWRGAWLLNNRWEASSVRFVKIISLAVPIVVVAGDAILGVITLNVSDAETSVKGILTGLFRGLVWAAYFQFSKRVRNTYYPVKPGEPVSHSDLPQYAEPDVATPSAFAAPPAAILAVAGQPITRLPDQSEPLIGTSLQTAIEDKLSPPKPQVDSVSVRLANSVVNDDALWAAALAELEEGQRHAATWARSFSAADGDEAKAKAAYLRERVHQMHQEATSARQTAEEEQRAVATEAEKRVAAAMKKFVEGSRITEDEIVTLVNASDEDYSLTRLTDRIRGNTLLHLCARHGLHEEALTLLRNGSNPDAGNGNGQKPFDMVASDTPLALTLRTA